MIGAIMNKSRSCMSAISQKDLCLINGALARSHIVLLIHILFVYFFISVPGAILNGGTTGKITGHIRDALTGEGLAGANIMIEGTYMGAATDLEGYYVILNVPPRVYDVKVMMIGYTTVRSTGARVSIDFTTKLDFQLRQAVLEGEEVSVTASRPIVRKDLTSSLSIVGSEELAEMPVEEFVDILALQAGIVVGSGGEIHMRGGRSSEISYMVDGLSVTDPFSGEIAIEIENASIQELQVISGTFNAEYGQAMSGIIDIVTKAGGDKFQGNISFYSGDYLSKDADIYMNISDVTPLDIRNMQVSLSGPVPLFGKRLTFFLTGRSYDTQGWLYGQTRFSPRDSSKFGNWTAGSDDLGADGLGPNDAQYPGPDLGEGDGSPTPGEPNVYVEETGDSSFIAMAPLTKISADGKLTYRISPSIKVSYRFFWDQVDSREYSHAFKLNPDGDYKQFKHGYSQALSWNHTLSSRSFYTIKFSDTFSDHKEYVLEDPLDTRYVDPKRLDDAGNNAFKTGGTEMWHSNRDTRSFQGKLDLTSQIHAVHLVKAGMSFRTHKLSFHEFEIIPKINDAGIIIQPFEPALAIRASIANNSYVKSPVQAAADHIAGQIAEAMKNDHENGAEVVELKK